MPPIVSYPSTSPQQYEMQTPPGPPFTSMAAPTPTPTPTPNIPAPNNAFCAALLPRETDKLVTSGVKSHYNSKPIGFPPQGNMLSNMHAKTARKSAFVETARSGYASSSSGSRKSGSGSSSAAVAAKKDNKRESNDIRESPKGIAETVAKFSNNEGVGASADQKKHSLSVPQNQTKIPPGFFKRSADIAHPASSPPVTSHTNSEPKPKRQKIATAKAAAMASVANMNLDKTVAKKRKPRQKKEKRTDTPKRGKDSEKKEPEKAKNVAANEKELSGKSKDEAQAKGTGVFTLSRSPVAENSETPTTYHTNESGVMPLKQKDLGPIPNPPQPNIHYQFQRKQTPDAIKQALQLREEDKRKRDSAPIPPPVPRVSQEMSTLSNISAEAVASNGNDIEKQLHCRLSHQLPTHFAFRGQEDVISISDSESPILPPKKSRGLEDVKQFGNKATPITIEDSCEEGDDDDISMGEAGSGIPEKAAPETTLNGELATVGTPDAQNYINHDFFAQICPDYAGDKKLLSKIQKVEKTVSLLLQERTENNLELKELKDYFQFQNHSDNLQDRIAFLFNKVGVLTTDGQIVKFEEWKMGGRGTFEGTPILLDHSKLWMGQKKDSTGYEARAAEETGEVDPAKAPPSLVEGNVQQETQRVFDEDIPTQLGDGEVADPVANAAKELEVGVCVMDVDDARKDSAPTNEKTDVNHRNRTKDELDELDLEGRTLTTQKHLTPPSVVDSTMSDPIKQFDLPVGVSITETPPVVPGTSPSQAASVEQAQSTIADCDLPLDFNMAPCSIMSGKTPRKTFGKARPRIEDVFREPPHAESTRQRRQSILTARQQQRDDPLLAKIAVLDRQERAIRAQLEKMVLHAKKTGQEMEKKIAELWQPLTATADGDEPQDKDPNLPASLCGPSMDYEGSLEAVKKRRKLQDEKRDFEEDTTRQQVKLLQKAIEISDEKNLAKRKRKLEMEEVSSTSHGRYYLPCNGTPSVSTPGTPSVAGTSSTESGNVLENFHPLLFGYPGESTGQTLFRELVQWAKEPSTPSQSASPALPTSATTSQPPKKKKPIRKKKNW